MLDKEGYRPNVGIILVNSRNQVFWGKRVREHAWQFPQGGISHGENPEQAMLRELYEEVAHAIGCATMSRTAGFVGITVTTIKVKNKFGFYYA